MPQIPQAAADALHGTDPLRLVIRTGAFIDRVLNETLHTALPSASGRTWAKGIPFERKLEIVAALDIIPPAAIKGFKAVMQLRHDFAHDQLPDGLTEERATEVLRAWEELLPDFVNAPLPQERAAEDDTISALIAALMVMPREVAVLKQACGAAVLIAQYARDQAPQVLADRRAGLMNRVLRDFAEARRQEALEAATHTDPEAQ